MSHNMKVQFNVKPTNYFSHMVLGSKMTTNECSSEQLHNIFDNGGTKVDIQLFDNSCKVLNLIKPETIPKYLVIRDNCPRGLKNPEGIMESLREKSQEQMNTGVGNFNFGEIGAIFNLGEA